MGKTKVKKKGYIIVHFVRSQNEIIKSKQKDCKINVNWSIK